MLIATDLASRGIDVADISHIINYDIPEDPEVYVHRVGRTARMGAEGKAFTFVSSEQGEELTKIENLINMVIPQATIEGFEPRPTPADWTEQKPVASSEPAKPIPSRFERPYGATTTTTTTTSSGTRQRAHHVAGAATHVGQQNPHHAQAQASALIQHFHFGLPKSLRKDAKSAKVAKGRGKIVDSG